MNYLAIVQSAAARVVEVAEGVSPETGSNQSELDSILYNLKLALKRAEELRAWKFPDAKPHHVKIPNCA